MDPFGGEDDDRESGASPDGSSDNDQDGPGEDRDDEDMDGNGPPEADADGENEEDNEDEDDEQDQDESQYTFGDAPNQGQTKPVQASQTSSTSNTSEALQSHAGIDGPVSAAPTSHPKPSALLSSPSPTQGSATSNGLSFELPKVRPEALTASVYDIVPTIAAPHSTSINSITATPDLRWVFTGGADGYIRKFNWLETANGKSMLTVAQRHPFVDSVTKAGVLMSYWDNTEEPAGSYLITPLKILQLMLNPQQGNHPRTRPPSHQCTLLLFSMKVYGFCLDLNPVGLIYNLSGMMKESKYRASAATLLQFPFLISPQMRNPCSREAGTGMSLTGI